MTSKCGKNKEVAHELQASCVSLMFLPHFDVQLLCDLILNRPLETKNLFVLYNVRSEKKETNTHTCLVPQDCLMICASFMRPF